MTLAIRQTVANANNMVLNFGGAPLDGSLLIVICTHWSNNPALSAGWTALTNIDAPIADGVKSAYKYCGPGEPTSQQPFTDGTAQQCQGWEITGVSGTIGTDVLSQHGEVDKACSPSFNTASFNTSADNVMILGLISGNVAVVNTEQLPTITAGQSNDDSALSNTATARHAAFQAFHQYVAASGSPVTYGCTFPLNQDLLARDMFVELAWEVPPTPSGGSNLLLLGV